MLSMCPRDGPGCLANRRSPHHGYDSCDRGRRRGPRAVASGAAKRRAFRGARRQCGEGVDVLRGVPIEMVITVLDMPQGRGLEVISVLRQDFPTTKVVVVAGEASEYEPLHPSSCLDAVEVLPKPVDVSHLIGTVHRVLRCQ